MKTFLSTLCLLMAASIYATPSAIPCRVLADTQRNLIEQTEQNLANETESKKTAKIDSPVPITSAERKKLSASLIGEWANTLYPFDLDRNDNRAMAGAFLYYRFNADGTYSKSLGNSEAQLEEVGRWEISNDGQYLIMHTKKTKKTSKARIKFIMFDEMVLEHSLKVSDESFCTNLKDFYFSRM